MPRTECQAGRPATSARWGREFGRKCASNTVATNKAFGGPVAHLSGRFEQAHHIRTPSRDSKFNSVEVMISLGDSNLE